MRYSILKWSRVVVALLFFLLTTLIFIDFRDLINSNYVIKIVWIQFLPSLIKFIALFSLTAGGFLIVIIATSLFGRLYCSVICPLGILQDFFSRTGKFLRVRKKFRYRKPAVILKNVIILIIILSIFTGSIILLNLLDPYSIFGKIVNGLVRPAGIIINNFITGIFESRGVYYLYHVDLLPVRFSALILPVFFTVLLLIIAGRYGRLYCNTICPVGTVLGWLSNYSVFRIVLNESKCTKCGKCSFACKSECINIRNLSIDHSNCVTCFNCLNVCPEDALDYKFSVKTKIPTEIPEANRGKRRFLSSSIGGLAILAGSEIVSATEDDNEPLNKRPTTIPEEKSYPVTPPGSLSISHFTSLCTACQLCVSKCPTGVLQPSFREYGLAGIMQPYMDFNTNYCNFECVRCSIVCPTGAILRLSDEAKLTTQIGKVILIIENCVVFTEETACGSCSEHCPTQAVRMIPYKGGLTIPEIDESICIGCGACEYACPVRPFKAIYVDGNPIHEIAKKPEGGALEGGVLDEFPF